MIFFKKLYLQLSDCDGMCRHCTGRLKQYCEEIKGSKPANIKIEKIRIIYKVTREDEKLTVEHNLSSNTFETLKIRLWRKSNLEEAAIKQIKLNHEKQELRP